MTDVPAAMTNRAWPLRSALRVPGVRCTGNFEAATNRVGLLKRPYGATEPPTLFTMRCPPALVIRIGKDSRRTTYGVHVLTAAAG